jgi:hypothetical protein
MKAHVAHATYIRPCSAARSCRSSLSLISLFGGCWTLQPQSLHLPVVLILAILFIQLSQPNLSLELNLILLDLLFYQQSLHAVMDKRAARYKSGDGNEYKDGAYNHAHEEESRSFLSSFFH